MNERTTIGGTVYEAIGSSSSNLLLRCNGTARIQWGNKLIDLIKNGKIASGDSSGNVSIISKASEIKSDGIYVLIEDDSLQLLVYKNGKVYNLSGTELYISASTKQDITAEQRERALGNIGMYYNTLKEVEDSGIQNGIVYVINTGTLYTIKEGVISEFEAKLKTVTVEQINEYGDTINSSSKVVLSILDQEYIVLEDSRIIAKQDVIVKEYAKICSENASDTSGYRLYIDGDTSRLEIDEIVVRNGLSNLDYITVTYDYLYSLYSTSKLKENQWYLLSNYRNPWEGEVRPLLLRALNQNSLYKEGKLFNDQGVTIHYVIEEPSILDSEESIGYTGRVIWMRDIYGNEANFDFLDPSRPDVTLHSYEANASLLSIFPRGSYNNKLIVNSIDIQTPDLIMHDNYIECGNLVIKSGCDSFYGNTLENISKLELNANFTNNKIKELIHKTSLSTFVVNHNFSNVVILKCINSEILESLVNVKIEVLDTSIIKASIIDSHFKNITNCEFDSGTITNVKCSGDLINYVFDSSRDQLLYNSAKEKEIYKLGNDYYIEDYRDHYMSRGMIMMHSGIVPIPSGWAVCDGGTYTHNGLTSSTPDLRAFNASSNLPLSPRRIES